MGYVAKLNVESLVAVVSVIHSSNHAFKSICHQQVWLHHSEYKAWSSAKVIKCQILAYL